MRIKSLHRMAVTRWGGSPRIVTRSLATTPSAYPPARLLEWQRQSAHPPGDRLDGRDSMRTVGSTAGRRPRRAPALRAYDDALEELRTAIGYEEPTGKAVRRSCDRSAMTGSQTRPAWLTDLGHAGTGLPIGNVPSGWPCSVYAQPTLTTLWHAVVYRLGTCRLGATGPGERPHCEVAAFAPTRSCLGRPLARTSAERSLLTA